MRDLIKFIARCIVLYDRQAWRRRCRSWKSGVAVVGRSWAAPRSFMSSCVKVTTWSSGSVNRCRPLCLTTTDRTMNIYRCEWRWNKTIYTCRMDGWQIWQMLHTHMHTHTHMHAHTHTHSHFMALLNLSRTTWVSQHLKGKTRKGKQSGFTGARNSQWQWHQLGHMQICTLTQTHNHASIPPVSFAGCPSCHSTNSIKALKALKNKCCCKIK